MCSHVVAESPAEPRAGSCHSSSEPEGGKTLERGDMLAEVAQKWGGCPIPGNIQGQVEGSEQSDPAEDTSAGCRVVGPEDIEKVPSKISTSPHRSVIPWPWKPGCWQGTEP